MDTFGYENHETKNIYDKIYNDTIKTLENMSISHIELMLDHLDDIGPGNGAINPGANAVASFNGCYDALIDLLEKKRIT